MKKLMVLCIILSVFAVSQLAAETGLGVEVGGGYSASGPGWDPWLTMKFEGLPYIGVGLGFGSEYFNLGLTADWWLVQEKLGGPVFFFFGLGPYVNIGISDTFSLALGARAPLGLQVFIAKWFEVFLEIAPSIGLGLVPTLYFPDWGIHGAVGLRFWF